MRDIHINGKTIGADAPVFLIAEAGVNHNGDLTNAKKLIDIAVKAKVDAVKFQTFITEKLITKATPKVEYQKTNSNDKENFYDMIKKYELSKEEFKILKDYSSEKGLIFLSTPFDDISVEWLEELNVPAYKIGSGDMNNFPLLELICSKGKPILLSTGMATLNEVKESVNFIKSKGIEDIIIFQCTTSYPASYKEINLNVIDTYRKEFPNMIIGFSDHSIGTEASIGAVAKSVKVIEKHFTLDKNMEGPDHKASMDPEELIKWVEAIRKIEVALGSYQKIPSKTELEIAKIARKSIISTKNLKPGDVIQAEDIILKRPGHGIPPKEYENIIGKKVKNPISKDSIIKWEDVQ